MMKYRLSVSTDLSKKQLKKPDQFGFDPVSFEEMTGNFIPIRYHHLLCPLFEDDELNDLDTYEVASDYFNKITKFIISGQSEENETLLHIQQIGLEVFNPETKRFQIMLRLDLLTNSYIF